MHRVCWSPLHALAHFIFLLTHQMRLITVYIFPGRILVLRKKGVPYSGSDEEKAEELGAAGGWGGTRRGRQGHCALFKLLLQVGGEC